jgi:hypothetical protein
MGAKPLTFSEWMNVEADRIVSLGLRVPPEHQAASMRVQIVTALQKALAHGRDGLRDEDPHRAVWENSN